MNGGKIPWIRGDQRKIGMVHGGPEEGPEIKGKDNGSGNPAEKGEEKKPEPVCIQPSPGFARGSPMCRDSKEFTGDRVRSEEAQSESSG